MAAKKVITYAFYNHFWLNIKGIFANAGVMLAGPMSGLKVDEWMNIVDINIKGVLNSMAAVLPEFIIQKSDTLSSHRLLQD